MGDAQPSPEALKRLQWVVSLTLVPVFALSVITALAEVWPTPWIDELGFSWFGSSSWRLRIVGNFAFLCGAILFPALLIAVAIKRLLKGSG